MTRTETEELRTYLTEMADGLVVTHEDGTQDPLAAAEITAWLLSLAGQGDE